MTKLYLEDQDFTMNCPAAQPGGPTARFAVLPFLPEDGRRSSFRNIILLKYRR
jgi:hypothetical protein